MYFDRLDLSVSQQGMFDDTYRRIPSEGWMFLPFTNYEGDGPAAWFEPLNQGYPCILCWIPKSI